MVKRRLVLSADMWQIYHISGSLRAMRPSLDERSLSESASTITRSGPLTLVSVVVWWADRCVGCHCVTAVTRLGDGCHRFARFSAFSRIRTWAWLLALCLVSRQAPPVRNGRGRGTGLSCPSRHPAQSCLIDPEPGVGCASVSVSEGLAQRTGGIG